MRIVQGAAVLLVVAMVTAGAPASLGAQQPDHRVNAYGAAVKEFRDRDGRVPGGAQEGRWNACRRSRRPTTRASSTSREVALGEAIRQARAGAKAGDVFGTELAPRIRDIIKKDWAQAIGGRQGGAGRRHPAGHAGRRQCDLSVGAGAGDVSGVAAGGAAAAARRSGVPLRRAPPDPARRQGQHHRRRPAQRPSRSAHMTRRLGRARQCRGAVSCRQRGRSRRRCRRRRPTTRCSFSPSATPAPATARSTKWRRRWPRHTPCSRSRSPS